MARNMEIRFVGSGRVQIASIREITKSCTRWVELSDEAWQSLYCVVNPAGSPETFVKEV